jgi:SpoVK/Ycf46/Vps4 family AAA+-type ATPase
MASGELLKKLFQSYKRRDDDSFYSAAVQVVAEEKRKNHNVLARDLQRILENGNGRLVDPDNLRTFETLPRDRERNAILIEVRSPDRYLPDIIINDGLKQQIEIITEEFRSSTILQTYGLKPRQKLLFFGPPGCGKTLAAEIISGELGLPLLYARFDAIVSSYLGETATNLRKVFDYANRGNWVVFFDEFDAIGKSRDDHDEHGELKRVVNTFLQLLDGFQGESIFIAATNHEGLLDNALWRRFDDVLYFNKPDTAAIKQLLKLKLKGFSHKTLAMEKFIPPMGGWAHADIERVCLEAIKIAVLSGQNELTDAHFQQALERQQHRAKLISNLGQP